MATRKELLRAQLRQYGSDPGVQAALTGTRTGRASAADLQAAIAAAAQPRYTGQVGPPAPTNVSLVPGTSPPPAFGGEAGQFLQTLFQARPAFVQQQGELLQNLGPSLRSAVFNASPELAQASGYLQQTFSDPFGGALNTYQDAIRQAQAARGFGGAGGTGPAGEEARFLTNFAERRRQELLPQLVGFGNNILEISGLARPPDLELAGLGSLALSTRRLELERQAGERQSQIAEQLFKQYQQSLNQSRGGSFSFSSSSSFQNLLNAGGRAGPFASPTEVQASLGFNSGGGQDAAFAEYIRRQRQIASFGGG